MKKNIKEIVKFKFYTKEFKLPITYELPDNSDLFKRYYEFAKQNYQMIFDKGLSMFGEILMEPPHENEDDMFIPWKLFNDSKKFNPWDLNCPEIVKWIKPIALKITMDKHDINLEVVIHYNKKVSYQNNSIPCDPYNMESPWKPDIFISKIQRIIDDINNILEG